MKTTKPTRAQNEVVAILSKTAEEISLKRANIMGEERSVTESISVSGLRGW